MSTKAELIANVNVQPFVVNGVKLLEVASDGMLRVNVGNFKLMSADAILAAQWIIDNFQTEQP